MEFSIKMEIVALVILLILSIYHLDRHNNSNTRYRLFSASLGLAMLMILFDIASTAALSGGDNISTEINVLLNTIYFITLDMTFSVMSVYCFYILFEHSVDRHCLYLASGIIAAFAVLLFAINILNIKFGWIFTFENGYYERGPLNRIGFIPLLIEVGMFCVCYLRNRSIIGSSMKRLVQTLPTIVVLIVAVQAAVPNLILTGTLAALVSMVLFINFQSNRNGRDALTGLLNRTSFVQEVCTGKKRGEHLHLIFVHLEKFEEVNKKYGIKMGDSILFAIGIYLEHQFPGYQVCRFGNTTFSLMARSAGKEADLAVVERMKERFEMPWIQGERETLVRVSIAHREADFDGYDENTALDQLEYALSSAREYGGCGIICFDKELEERYQRKEYVLNRVKWAIRARSFEVFYQPIYGCREKQFRTAESLVRLRDSDGNYISPAEFIPLAEKNGMLDEISVQVLEQVYSFLAEHRDMEIDQISINMSVGQILDPGFPDLIHHMRRKYGIQADKIRIEITERTMAEEPELVEKLMKEFAEDGIKFYLDDFGIGYSNLAMVVNLPFETVKLDSSLVLKMMSGENGCNTLRLLIEMLHNSGFYVVAEGIETEEEMQAVRKLPIDRIQGFYYARPMPGKAYAEFVRGKNGNPKKES